MKYKGLGFVVLLGLLLFVLVEYWPVILAGVVLAVLAAIIIVVKEKKDKEEWVNAVDLTVVDMMPGLEFEQYIAELLKRNGYTKVQITKASGDYGVDVLATLNGKKYAFQCKCYSGNIGVKAVQEIYSGAKMYHAEIPVVIINSWFTPNAVNLARELTVQLWDRNKLRQLIAYKASAQDFPASGYDQLHATLARSTSTAPMPKVEQPTVKKISSEEVSIPPLVGKKEHKNREEQTTLNKIEVNLDMATVLGAGTYVFGKNIPKGEYDLFAVRGRGTITPYDREGEEQWLIHFGLDDNDYAREYRGMSSDEVKKFVVEGSVEFEIKRSQMITIE